MLGRLGNVIYWFFLVIMIGCLCFGIYQRCCNAVTLDQYNHYLSWAGPTPNSWAEYEKSHTDDKNNSALAAAAAGIVVAIIGKAIQYILGGTWKISDFDRMFDD